MNDIRDTYSAVDSKNNPIDLKLVELFNKKRKWVLYRAWRKHWPQCK